MASSKLEHMLVHITVFVSFRELGEKAIGHEQTEIFFLLSAISVVCYNLIFQLFPLWPR